MLLKQSTDQQLLCMVLQQNMAYVKMYRSSKFADCQKSSASRENVSSTPKFSHKPVSDGLLYG